MSRPSDIPQDVWETARDVLFDFDCDWTADGRRIGGFEETMAAIFIARAILAERERCARIARMFVGYADSDAGSVHSRDAKELAESTASWIEHEITGD